MASELTMAELDKSAEARAHALGSCPKSSRRSESETPGAQAERHLYLALLGALEAGLVRTVNDALAVLRQASRPLGPMGAEWLQAQERRLRPEAGQSPPNAGLDSK